MIMKEKIEKFLAWMKEEKTYAEEYTSAKFASPTTKTFGSGEIQVFSECIEKIEDILRE